MKKPLAKNPFPSRSPFLAGLLTLLLGVTAPASNGVFATPIATPITAAIVAPAATPTTALTWREIDSPAFITNQDSYLIGQEVIAGNVFQYIAPGLMYGLVAKHLDLQGFWQASAVFATTLGTMYVLKNAALRQRPNGASDYQSFPSGHTAATMAPAAFVTLRYGFWESIPFWGIGIFTAYSRVAGRAHFITDTLASTALSLFFAYLFVTPLADEETAKGREKILILPTASQDGLGLTMALRF